MNEAEILIIILLGFVVYFLYQIARQLTFITGKRMKVTFFKWKITRRSISQKEEKIVN
jgi:hypothetical protein